MIVYTRLTLFISDGAIYQSRLSPIAVRDVAEVQGGISKLAESVSLTDDGLYKHASIWNRLHIQNG